MQTSSEPFNILPPAAVADNLVFQVFDQAVPIGYARLKKRKPPSKLPAGAIDMFDPDGVDSYELKMIEISQNYRHRGVGTALLNEVIRFCRHRNIKHLTGEIKGDLRNLRRWYSHNGFSVANNDKIDMFPLAGEALSA